MHWPDPALVIGPELEHGPVLVQIEYKIDPVHHYEFALAAKDLGSIRSHYTKYNHLLTRHLLRRYQTPNQYKVVFLLLLLPVQMKLIVIATLTRR